MQKIWYGIKWFFIYHFKELPRIKESGKRWGIFQFYLTLALFFIALYFPFKHDAGTPMTIGDWVGYIILGIGFVLVLYSIFLGYKYMRVTSKDNTATKDDINQLKTELGSKIDETNRLLRELVERWDRR